MAKNKRVSYKKMTIARLEAQGLDKAMAQSAYNRAYQQAYRALRRTTKSKDINITFEVYRSAIRQEDRLFNIGFDIAGGGIDVKARLSYEGGDAYKKYLSDRFYKMGQRYEEIANYVSQMERGEISEKELIDKINYFKKHDIVYLENGGNSP